MKNLLRIFFSIPFTLMFWISVQAEEPIVPESIAGTTEITAEELIKLAETDPKLVIIDARIPSDHAKGHIEGSISLPDTDTTAKSLASHIPSKSTPVVFYCNGIRCNRSVNASKIAVASGYRNIYWFRGGWAEWTEKGYPITRLDAP